MKTATKHQQASVVKNLKPTFAPAALTPVAGANSLVSHQTSVTVMAGLGAFGMLSAVLAAVGIIPVSTAVAAAGVLTLAGTAWMYVTRPIAMPTSPPMITETTRPPVQVVSHPESDEQPYTVDQVIRNQHNEPDRFLPPVAVKPTPKAPLAPLARAARAVARNKAVQIIIALPIVVLGAGLLSTVTAGTGAKMAQAAAFFGSPEGWLMTVVGLVAAWGLSKLVIHLIKQRNAISLEPLTNA